MPVGASPEVLVILHEDGYHLGRFEPLLAAQGIRTRIVHSSVRSLTPLNVRDFDGLISLGGDIGAYEEHKHPQLNVEIALMEQAHTAGTPILGVCLGGQLLARALGAEVRPQRGGEIGWQDVTFLTEDPLLGPPGKRRKYLWHQDSFTLPSGARHLATSERCEYQAFALENSYGLQFHPEVTLRQIRSWKTGPSGTMLGVKPQQADAILRDARAEEARYAGEAERLIAALAAKVRGRNAA